MEEVFTTRSGMSNRDSVTAEQRSELIVHYELPFRAAIGFQSYQDFTALWHPLACVNCSRILTIKTMCWYTTISVADTHLPIRFGPFSA